MVQPRSRAAWRSWLRAHHAASAGVWLVYAKKHTGLPSLSWDDAVEEALCFGWIDSLRRRLDDTFFLQLFTPRKPKSAWSALNKTRVTRLIKDGLMTPAGMAAIELAKRTGTWNRWDAVDALVEPPELAAALDASARTRKKWDALRPAQRKRYLYWLANVKRPDTRAARVREIVRVVANGPSLPANVTTRTPAAGGPAPSRDRRRR